MDTADNSFESDTVFDWSWKDAIRTGTHEEEKVYEFQNHCKSISLDVSKVCSIGEPEELCLLRYLRGNGLDVTKATDQLQESAAWREEIGIQNIIAKTPAEILGCDPEETTKYFPHWQRGFDKLGRPVLIKQYGGFETKHLKEMTTLQALVDWHIWEQEMNAALLSTQSKLQNKPVTQYCIILDLEGMELRQVGADFLWLVKAIAKVDQCHHPERMGKTFIINTPRVFPMVWRGITPFLDHNTVSKIALFSKRKDWVPALLDMISTEQLPVDYGGTGPALFAAQSVAEGKVTPEQRPSIFESVAHRLHRTAPRSRENSKRPSYFSRHDSGSHSMFNSRFPMSSPNASPRLSFDRNGHHHLRTLPDEVARTRNLSQSCTSFSSDDSGFLGGIVPRDGSKMKHRVKKDDDFPQERPELQQAHSLSEVYLEPFYHCLSRALPSFSTAFAFQEKGVLCCFRVCLSWAKCQEYNYLGGLHDKLTMLLLAFSGVAIGLGAFVLESADNITFVELPWVGFVLVCTGVLSLLMCLVVAMGWRMENKSLLLLSVFMLEAELLFHVSLSLFSFSRAGGVRLKSVGLQQVSAHSELQTNFVLCGIGHVLQLVASIPVLILSLAMAEKLHHASLVSTKPVSLSLLNTFAQKEKFATWTAHHLSQLRSTLNVCGFLSFAVSIISGGFACHALREQATATGQIAVGINYLLMVASICSILVSCLGLWSSKSYGKLPFYVFWVFSFLLLVFLIGDFVVNFTEASKISSQNGLHRAGIVGLFADQVIVGVLESLMTVFHLAEAVVALVVYRDTEAVKGWTENTRKLTFIEKLLVAWGVISGLCFIFISGTFAMLYRYIANGKDNWGTAYWHFLGRVDNRYKSADSFMVSTSGILAVFVGPSSLLYAWAVYDDRPFKHILALSICTIQIYTQVLFVSMEVLSRFSHISKNGYMFGFCFILLNLLTIVCPILVALYALKQLAADAIASIKYKSLLESKEVTDPLLGKTLRKSITIKLQRAKGLILKVPRTSKKPPAMRESAKADPKIPNSHRAN